VLEVLEVLEVLGTAAIRREDRPHALRTHHSLRLPVPMTALTLISTIAPGQPSSAPSPPNHRWREPVGARIQQVSRTVNTIELKTSVAPSLYPSLASHGHIAKILNPNIFWTAHSPVECAASEAQSAAG
jgi:hypothetical protein